MREIIFRGKRIDNGEWVYGYYYLGTPPNAKPEHMITTGIYNWKVDPETVGQYTGRKDKKNAEIYEDDKMQESFDGIKIERFGPIAWNYDELCWDLGGIGLAEFDISDIKIVGNIHGDLE